MPAPRKLSKHSKDDNVSWQFSIPPKAAPRVSASVNPGGNLRVASEAKDNMADFVLANGSTGSNQSGESDTRRTVRKICPGRTSFFSAN
jgi:hypothetical protein